MASGILHALERWITGLTDFPGVTNVLNSTRTSSLTWKAKYKNPKRRKKTAIVACGSESCTEFIETAILQEGGGQPPAESKRYSDWRNDFECLIKLVARVQLSNDSPRIEGERWVNMVRWPNI